MFSSLNFVKLCFGSEFFCELPTYSFNGPCETVPIISKAYLWHSEVFCARSGRASVRVPFSVKSERDDRFASNLERSGGY